MPPYSDIGLQFVPVVHSLSHSVPSLNLNVFIPLAFVSIDTDPHTVLFS